MPGRALNAPRRRGVAMLWFLLVMLPLLLIGSTLAVDITRLIATSREVSNMTEAAALAGSQQYLTGSYRLDEVKAEQAARALLDQAEQVGVFTADIDNVDVTISDNPYNAQRVTVTVNFTVSDLAFMSSALWILRGDTSSVQQLTIERSADVCLPGEYQPTGGNCIPPKSSNR